MNLNEWKCGCEEANTIGKFPLYAWPQYKRRSLGVHIAPAGYKAGIPFNRVMELIELSFNSWESVIDVSFALLLNSNNADIVITFDTLHPGYYGVATLYMGQDQVRTRISNTFPWEEDESMLMGVLQHEIGHNLGFHHLPWTKYRTIMDPGLSTTLAGLTAKDITQAVKHGYNAWATRRWRGNYISEKILLREIREAVS